MTEQPVAEQSKINKPEQKKSYSNVVHLATVLLRSKNGMEKRLGGSKRRCKEKVQICSNKLHLKHFQRESLNLQGLKQMYFPVCLNHRQLEI